MKVLCMGCQRDWCLVGSLQQHLLTLSCQSAKGPKGKLVALRVTLYLATSLCPFFHPVSKILHHGPRSTTFPLSSKPPVALPTAHPKYAPVKIVTGHFCHCLSQSSGIGTAPNHAPTQAPRAAPKTSSIGTASLAISFHFSVSTPCV